MVRRCLNVNELYFSLYFSHGLIWLKIWNWKLEKIEGYCLRNEVTKQKKNTTGVFFIYFHSICSPEFEML